MYLALEIYFVHISLGKSYVHCWLVAVLHRLSDRINVLHNIRIAGSEVFVPIYNITVTMLQRERVT